MWLAIYIIIALFVFPIWQSFYNYNRRKKIQKEYDALKYKYESLLKESNSVGNRLPINKFIEEKRTGFIPVDIQENVWKRDGENV